MSHDPIHDFLGASLGCVGKLSLRPWHKYQRQKRRYERHREAAGQWRRENPDVEITPENAAARRQEIEARYEPERKEGRRHGKRQDDKEKEMRRREIHEERRVENEEKKRVRDEAKRARALAKQQSSGSEHSQSPESAPLQFNVPPSDAESSDEDDGYESEEEEPVARSTPARSHHSARSAPSPYVSEAIPAQASPAHRSQVANVASARPGSTVRSGASSHRSPAASGYPSARSPTAGNMHEVAGPSKASSLANSRDASHHPLAASLPAGSRASSHASLVASGYSQARAPCAALGDMTRSYVEGMTYATQHRPSNNGSVSGSGHSSHTPAELAIRSRPSSHPSVNATFRIPTRAAPIGDM